MPDGGLIHLTAENCSIKKNEHPILTVGNYIRIVIKDSGLGIAEEAISHIFDPFFTTKEMGHGLGLATCYSIIKRHGGCIDVDSTVGVGTAFTVYLPAVLSRVSDLQKSHRVIHSGCGTVLVMDDEEMMRGTISGMLKHSGYLPLCTCDGKETIAQFNEEITVGRTIAALILDLTVPNGMGGVATVAEIRKIDPLVPVFVASGYADDPVMTNPTAYGFTASIAKPFGKDDLAEMLTRYILQYESVS